MNRRGFLTSFAAIAATAVAGPTLGKVSISDQERLVALMKAGIVENQKFLLNGRGFVIANIKNIIFKNCSFVVLNTTAHVMTVHRSDITFHDCVFDRHLSSGMNHKSVGIFFEL